MGQPFVGQVIAVGFNFVPAGWLSCDGSLQPISEYEALYALIGTTYGGNGTTTFGMPDLRGRSPVDAGQGAGLSTYVMGQIAGAEAVTLTASQIGSHSHQLVGSSQTGTITVPAGTVAIGQVVNAEVSVFAAAPATTALSGTAIGPFGGSLPHENRQPFLTINYIICYAGIFPSQS
jgi:microcystin-dependent protein